MELISPYIKEHGAVGEIWGILSKMSTPQLNLANDKMRKWINFLNTKEKYVTIFAPRFSLKTTAIVTRILLEKHDAYVVVYGSSSIENMDMTIEKLICNTAMQTDPAYTLVFKKFLKNKMIYYKFKDFEIRVVHELVPGIYRRKEMNLYIDDAEVLLRKELLQKEVDEKQLSYEGYINDFIINGWNKVFMVSSFSTIDDSATKYFYDNHATCRECLKPVATPPERSYGIIKIQKDTMIYAMAFMCDLKLGREKYIEEIKEANKRTEEEINEIAEQWKYMKDPILS